MDIVLNQLDSAILTPFIYSASWKESDPVRQFLSLIAVSFVLPNVFYIVTATLSYLLLFDHRLMDHPLFMKNQIRKELVMSFKSNAMVAIPTAAIFWVQVQGYSKLYDGDMAPEMGWPFIVLSIGGFALFTDFFIYWIHRVMHYYPFLYKHIHKDHHSFKVPSPFASQSLHPLDAFVLGLPYHFYPFLFPLHKIAYLSMFTFGVSVWTVSFHDGNVKVPDILKSVINGAAHHTDHHLYYNYNYGQFLTLFDVVFGSYRHPSMFQGKGPMATVLARKSKTDEKIKIEITEVDSNEYGDLRKREKTSHDDD